MLEPDPRGSRLTGMRVLLVEDDLFQLDACRRALEALGCAVSVAASAEAGIELARSSPFDAILTDNILSGMTGLRSIVEYAIATRSPIFLMTSHFSAEVEKDALLVGARRVFAKPLVWDDIALELASVRGLKVL